MTFLAVMAIAVHAQRCAVGKIAGFLAENERVKCGLALSARQPGPKPNRRKYLILC
jgi:hypothetical protein